jgi:hypothetical protein
MTNFRNLAKLPALLDHIDPDVSYPDWFSVLAAIHHETEGSEEGFELADAWSSGGKSYKGTGDVRRQWSHIKGGLRKPITLGTLIHMARRS